MTIRTFICIKFSVWQCLPDNLTPAVIIYIYIFFLDPAFQALSGLTGGNFCDLTCSIVILFTWTLCLALSEMSFNRQVCTLRYNKYDFLSINRRIPHNIYLRT